MTDHELVDVREQTALNLAFLGDSVYEQLVRKYIVARHRMNPGKMHAMAVKYVCCDGQFEALKAIEPLLTEDEQNIVRRGRNSVKVSVPKHASPEIYRASTGFEALFGWLCLTGQENRIQQLFDTILENLTQLQG